MRRRYSESYIARYIQVKTGATLASESISLFDSRDRLLPFEAASIGRRRKNRQKCNRTKKITDEYDDGIQWWLRHGGDGELFVFVYLLRAIKCG